MESLVAFKDEVLDRYLEIGWFRMYDSMFTTSSIELEDKVYLVYWLRYCVSRVAYGKKQKDIISKNRKFYILAKPLFITEELEALFALYKRIKPFIGYYSLADAFRTNGPVFDTWVIEVRDENNLLIAAGIFDKGKNSIAGIMNFYHPEYDKYSLGKLLILAKINYCKENLIPFYYPGYITNEPSRFGYKLFPDKRATEVFEESSGRWLPYNIWKQENNRAISP
jgi:leucyl-tRNA---protein transferase